MPLDRCCCQRAQGPSISLLTVADTVSNIRFRWLIDTDKDAEGMRVIADLHGGDPQNEEAQFEFQEIKDRVMAEVRSLKSKLA